MAGSASIQKQIPIVINLPVDEVGVTTADLVQQLRVIADEVRGYTERIEAALSHEQLFYNEEEIAEMFDISILTVQRMRRDGKIPYKRVAGKIVFTRRHLEEFLSS